MSRRRRALKRLIVGFCAVILAATAVSYGLHGFLVSVGRTALPVTEIKIAGRRVVIWKPSGVAPTNGYPVVLFSHGFLGCAAQSLSLTQGLAQAGYFVLAPDHQDAACGTGQNGRHFARITALWPKKPFFNPSAWSETTYRDRADDLEAILNAILKEKTFQGVPIDAQRIGLAGHSLGGYTVLGMAGAWPSWKDARVKAVLALSPYCTPYIRKGNFRRLGVPVMYQGGTLDFGVTPFVRRGGGAYDLTSPPKFFVELAGASHFAWTNLSRRYQPLICDYAVAFFDRFLKGEANPDPLTPLINRPWPQSVGELRFSFN